MAHTFDSEVSLHSWLLWPTVRRGFMPPQLKTKQTKKLSKGAEIQVGRF